MEPFLIASIVLSILFLGVLGYIGYSMSSAAKQAADADTKAKESALSLQTHTDAANKVKIKQLESVLDLLSKSVQSIVTALTSKDSSTLKSMQEVSAEQLIELAKRVHTKGTTIKTNFEKISTHFKSRVTALDNAVRALLNTRNTHQVETQKEADTLSVQLDNLRSTVEAEGQSFAKTVDAFEKQVSASVTTVLEGMQVKSVAEEKLLALLRMGDHVSGVTWDAVLNPIAVSDEATHLAACAKLDGALSPALLKMQSNSASDIDQGIKEVISVLNSQKDDIQKIRLTYIRKHIERVRVIAEGRGAHHANFFLATCKSWSDHVAAFTVDPVDVSNLKIALENATGPYKAQLHIFVDILRTALRRLWKPEATLRSFLNMRFLGNPGTGKTSVGKLLFAFGNTLGIYPGKEFFVDGNLLVGANSLQSSQLVEHAMLYSIGGLLFVDEAYTLCGSSRTREQVASADALVYWTEELRGAHTTVLAGYEKELNETFLCNVGLARRFPYPYVMKTPSIGDVSVAIANRLHKVWPLANDAAVNTLAQDIDAHISKMFNANLTIVDFFGFGLVNVYVGLALENYKATEPMYEANTGVLTSKFTKRVEDTGGAARFQWFADAPRAMSAAAARDAMISRKIRDESVNLANNALKYTIGGAPAPAPNYTAVANKLVI